MSQLTMYRGDTSEIVATVSSGLDGTGINGWSFWFTAKYDLGDADSAAVIRKLPTDFAINTAGDANTPGIAFAVINPADTASLPGHTVVLSYDLQAKDTSGNVYTLDAGTLTISADATQSTS